MVDTDWRIVKKSFGKWLTDFKMFHRITISKWVTLLNRMIDTSQKAFEVFLSKPQVLLKSSRQPDMVYNDLWQVYRHSGHVTLLRIQWSHDMVTETVIM